MCVTYNIEKGEFKLAHVLRRFSLLVGDKAAGPVAKKDSFCRTYLSFRIF